MRGYPRTPWWREKIDLGVYPQGLFLMLRNPLILLGPIPAALLSQVVRLLLPTGDMLGIGMLIQLILDAFGLALAIVVADMVWRLGRTSFDQAWEETRRKAGEICYAALGCSMVVFAAEYIGGLVNLQLGAIFSIVATALLTYAIAACTIGGVPGALSLQASLNMAKLRPINTVILVVFCLIAYYLMLVLLLPYIAASGMGPMAMVVFALAKSVVIAFSGTVIAKRYADIAFRNM